MNLGIIIGIVVVLIVLAVIFKFKEIRHKIGLIVAIFLFLFLVASVLHLYKNSDKVDLTSFDGVVSTGKLYFSWLGSIASNVIKVGGYAVNQDWSFDSINKTVQNKPVVKK